MLEGNKLTGSPTVHQQFRPKHRRSASFPGVLNNNRTHTGRSVEQKYGLINALDNLLDRLTESFKPLGDFLCKQWKSLSRLGRDTKHQAKQGLYDLRKEVAGSKLERVRLEAQKQKEDLQYKGTEQAGAIKNRLKGGLKRLFD